MAQRHREHGQGSIWKECDKEKKWTGRFKAVTPRGIGAEKQRWFTGKSYAEVERRLKGELDARAKGMTLPDERLTVAEYLSSWLEGLPSLGRVRATTLGFYSSYVNRHLIPGIGNLPLVRLSPMKLQSFIKQQLVAGVSAKTVS